MAESFGNQPTTPTFLAAGITNVQTSITVTNAAAPWPQTGQFRIRLISGEYALVTAGAGTTTWTVTRGVEGSTAASQPSGSIVVPVLTAGALAQFKTDIIAAITGTAPISVSGGVVAISDATSSQRGAMTTAYASMLDLATQNNTINTIVKRDGNGDFAAGKITATELYGTTTTVEGTAPTSLIGVTAGTNLYRRYNPSNVTVGAIVGQANSATITASTSATGSTIAQRDASGYIFAAYFNSNSNEFIAGTPYAIYGRAGSGDGFLRTYNPAAVSVGFASNAGTASTAGTANNATNWIGHAMYSPGGNYAIGALSDIDVAHGLGVQPRICTAFWATVTEGFSAVAPHPCVPGRFSGTYTDEVVVALVDSTKVSFRNRRNETVYVFFTVMA